jgi:hypothetical protein
MQVREICNSVQTIGRGASLSTAAETMRNGIIRWCSYEGVEYLELRYLSHGVDRFLLRKPVPQGAPRVPRETRAGVAA